MQTACVVSSIVRYGVQMVSSVMRKLLTFDPSIRSSSSLSLSPPRPFGFHTDFGPAVIVVWKPPWYPLTNFICPSSLRFLASSSSSSFRLKVARLNGSRDPFFFERPVVLRLLAEPPGTSPVDRIVDHPSLAAIFLKSGRRVARLPAVMARPCSVVDQIAMSVVAPKNRLLVRARGNGSHKVATYTRSRCS